MAISISFSRRVSSKDSNVSDATPDQTPPMDEHRLIAERRAKLDKMREQGVAFPNDFRRDALAEELHIAYGDRPPEWFESHAVPVKVGGRMMGKRGQGKVSFVDLVDRSGKIQLFVH